MYGGSDVRSLASEEWLGEPNSGDFDQGSGVSTSQLMNPNVSLQTAKGSSTGATGPAWQQSPGIFVALIVLLVVLRFGEREVPNAGVRVGLENWTKVGLLSATFLYAMKMIFSQLKVPALTQFFGAI